MTDKQKYDLEERLLRYSTRIIKVADETEQLIKIFVKSIKAAQNNNSKSNSTLNVES